MSTTTSTQYTINMRDIWRGLLIAVLSPIATIIITSLNQGSLTFDWKAIGGVAIAAALTYLLKNFLTPAQVVIADASIAKMVKEGDATVKVVQT